MAGAFEVARDEARAWTVAINQAIQIQLRDVIQRMIDTNSIMSTIRIQCEDALDSRPRVMVAVILGPDDVAKAIELFRKNFDMGPEMKEVHPSEPPTPTKLN